MPSFFPISVLQSGTEAVRSTDAMLFVDPVTQETKNTTVGLFAAMIGAVANVALLGGVGDGITDSTAAVTAAEAAAPYYVPTGNYLTTIGQASLRGPLRGDGQIITSDGNKRGKYFSAIAAAPASLGNWSSVLTAFNGDLSKVQFAVEHRVTGATTLGNPSSGYVINPETSVFAVYGFNSSGKNASLTINDGRTGSALFRVYAAQFGQGDYGAFSVNGFVNSTNPGASSFLAQPAVTGFTGNFSTGANYTYLNPGEFLLEDNGWDCSGIGFVFNLLRTNATGAQECVWHGLRVQSKQSAKIDSAYFASGNMKVFADAAHASADSVIARKADQWNHFNVTPDAATFKKYPTLTEYKEGYNSGSSAWEVHINSVVRLVLSTSGVGFNGSTAIAKPTITGSRGANAALANLLTQLANYGLVTDSTTA